MPSTKTAISKPIYGVCATEYSPLSKTSFCNPDSPELTSATEEVQVVWWNNHGYTHESPVEAVCLDNGELSLQLSDEDGESITLWEDSDFAFEHPTWLNGILNGMKEATEQS